MSIAGQKVCSREANRTPAGLTNGTSTSFSGSRSGGPALSGIWTARARPVVDQPGRPACRRHNHHRVCLVGLRASDATGGHHQRRITSLIRGNDRRLVRPATAVQSYSSPDRKTKTMAVLPKVIVITGGGTGIGQATAKAVVAQGDLAVIVGRRADVLAAAAASTGARPVVADLSRVDEVVALVADVVATEGRIDGVVSNAGVMIPGSVLDLTQDQWDQTLAINLTPTFSLAKAAMPHLIQSGGSWVSVSSIAGLRTPPGATGYATSKAALIMLTQSLAVDFGPLGVRSNTVCPGWVHTEMADAEMAEFGQDAGLSVAEAYQHITRLVPQRRPGQAHEVADAILWLLGTQASYVNGAVLTIDGGTNLVDAGGVGFDFNISPRATAAAVDDSRTGFTPGA